MMDERAARRVLGVLPEDSTEEIRKKYRNLMRKVHPDNYRDSSCYSTSGAQELNEAYAMLRNSTRAATAKAAREHSSRENGRTTGEHSVTDWEGPVNPQAYRPRRIFFSGMEHEGHHTGSFQMTEGKFLWDPENEEFEMLLRSVGFLSRQILEETEDRYSVWLLEREQLLEYRRPYWQELFHLLMLEYVDPAVCLDQLVRLWGTDGDKSIYRIDAVLKRECTAGEKNTLKLTGGMQLYPAGMKERRLYVCDKEGTLLGYLTFEEDWLFYAVIPVLERRDAQVKIIVGDQKNTSSGKRHRGTKEKHIALDLYIRLLVEEISVQESAARNQQIERVLSAYARQLETATNGCF